MSEISNLEEQHKKLVARKSELEGNIKVIDTVLSSKKNELRKLIDECKERGYDPDNLKAELETKKEVLRVKLETFKGDIEAAEKIVNPLMEVINNSNV